MNRLHEHHTLSRATSRASARSIIRKNIEHQDLKPADVLLERFVAWKFVVKQLTSYFEGIANIEKTTAPELRKLAGLLQVPFKAGNQFLGEGGLQDIYDVRDRTRRIADQHADLGRTIDSSIVQHLQKLKAEIKAHIKNLQNDTAKLAAGVAKERELSMRLIGELKNNVSTLKNTPLNLLARQDPLVANLAISHQLRRQVLEENLLKKSIVMMQKNSAAFEDGIVRSIQSAWATFDEWQARASTSNRFIFRSQALYMASLAPDREWIQFAVQSDHLLSPETPLRDPQAIIYPLKDDPAVAPVNTGRLKETEPAGLEPRHVNVLKKYPKDLLALGKYVNGGNREQGSSDAFLRWLNTIQEADRLDHKKTMEAIIKGDSPKLLLLIVDHLEKTPDRHIDIMNALYETFPGILAPLAGGSQS